MTQKQMIEAYVVLCRISGVQVDAGVAFDLYRIRKNLESYYSFCAERERVIIEKYNGSLENGNVSFSDSKDAANAQSELNALYSMEVDKEFTPITISHEALKNCTLSVNDLDTLNGIVTLI